jgi:hypothetical protein
MKLGMTEFTMHIGLGASRTVGRDFFPTQSLSRGALHETLQEGRSHQKMASVGASSLADGVLKGMLLAGPTLRGAICDMRLGS